MNLQRPLFETFPCNLVSRISPLQKNLRRVRVCRSFTYMFFFFKMYLCCPLIRHGILKFSTVDFDLNCLFHLSTTACFLVVNIAVKNAISKEKKLRLNFSPKNQTDFGDCFHRHQPGWGGSSCPLSLFFLSMQMCSKMHIHVPTMADSHQGKSITRAS